MTKFVKDKYFTVRGGRAKLVDITCAQCHTLVITYQKDGDGPLHRCYLNRIVTPEIVNAEQLRCTVCGSVVGTQHIHKDGRVAFNLVIGTYVKKLSTQK